MDPCTMIRLRLNSPHPRSTATRHTPIDQFFRSLAQDVGPKEMSPVVKNVLGHARRRALRIRAILVLKLVATHVDRVSVREARLLFRRFEPLQHVVTESGGIVNLLPPRTQPLAYGQNLLKCQRQVFAPPNRISLPSGCGMHR